MYNTDFEVKYHDIKEELTWKLKNKTPEKLELKTEYEYVDTDVLLICDKLYRDELCSVFYAESIIDDKIEIGMKYVLEKIILNNDFKLIINEMKNVIFMMNEIDNLSKDEYQYFIENFNLMSILILFKEDTFYLFHKCICQQLTLETIDSNLLDELMKSIIVSLKTE
jgi:hypothetical protein